jgi:hypothetical protein
MINLVVDMGTDAKIAKFLRCRLELIDLAVLEPIKVHPGSLVEGAPSLHSISSN